jgi:uncharacterized protein YjeT (DUF2065 family)
MSETLLSAIALVLILEGVLPFLAPGLWRETFRRITELADGQLRFIGLASMALGLIILFFVNR